MNIWVGKIIAELNGRGICAVRAFPSGKMPELKQPCAGVRLRYMDADKTEVLISILAPAALGGGACEDTAQSAGYAVEALGGQWQLGCCEFDSRSGTFCTELYAVFTAQTEYPVIMLGNETVKNGKAFTAWRSTDEAVTSLESAPWYFRLEEIISTGTEGKMPAQPFSITVSCCGRQETYTGCTWISQKREATASGIRQIREGIAQGRSTTA